MKSNSIKYTSESPGAVDQKSSSVKEKKIQSLTHSRSNSSDSMSSKDSKSWYISSGEESNIEGNINQIYIDKGNFLESQLKMSPKHQSQASIVIKNIPQSYNQLLDGFLIGGEEEFNEQHQNQHSSHMRTISDTDSVVIKGSKDQSDPDQSWSEDSDLSLAEIHYTQIYKNFKKASNNSAVSKNQGSLTSTCSGGFPQILTAKSSIVETQNLSKLHNQNKSLSASPYPNENFFIYSTPEQVERSEIQLSIQFPSVSKTSESEYSNIKSQIKRLRSQEKSESIHSDQSERYERIMQTIQQHEQKIKQIPIDFQLQQSIQNQIQQQTGVQISTTAQTQITQENEMTFDKNQFTFEQQISETVNKGEQDSPYVTKETDTDQDPCFMFCGNCQKVVPISDINYQRLI